MGCSNSFDSKESLAQLIKKGSFSKISLFIGPQVQTGAVDLMALRTPDQKRTHAMPNLFAPAEAVLDPDFADSIKHYTDDHVPFYKNYRQYLLLKPKANSVHAFAAELSKRKVLSLIATIHLDGLMNTSCDLEDSNIYEICGNVRTAKCTKCSSISPIKPFNDKVLAGDHPVKCEREGCDGKLYPNLFFNGGSLPEKFNSLPIHQSASDLTILVGTLGKEGTPAGALLTWRDPKSKLVIISKDPSEVASDLFIQGEPDKICSDLLQLLTSNQQ